MTLVVDAVPEPPSSSYFVLPLLHRVIVDSPRAEATLEWVLAITAMTGVGGDPFPGDSGVGRSD